MRMDMHVTIVNLTMRLDPIRMDPLSYSLARRTRREDVDTLALRYPDFTHATRYEPELEVAVDPVRALRQE